ncbi:MAG: hypothetical protein ACXWF8_00195 [Methylobacter sp.]
MKQIKIVEPPGYGELTEYKQRVAFHEAGHAAGICLSNKARKLSPVRFKIIFKGMVCVAAETESTAYKATYDKCEARIEGGRLIEPLLQSIGSLTHEVHNSQEGRTQLINAYMVAFEADIINLLIGPLAEAKRIAEMDDELFNQKLVNLRALENYGGKTDLVLANKYLQRYSADKQQQADKLNELFNAAFNFISDADNWAAITKLAAYILGSQQDIIGYEEIVSTLEQWINRTRVEGEDIVWMN